MVERDGHFRTDRVFEVDPENYSAMKLFGVRYVISSESSMNYQNLKADPHYRPLGSKPTFYKIYEYIDAQPPFSWEADGSDDQIECRKWQPEDRAFEVHSLTGGKLALHEQFFPGWTASIDGQPATVEHWMGAFQAVKVPAGEHRVEYRYRPRLLNLGMGISLLALILLAIWIIHASKAQVGSVQ
jgi:hypothetical protein